MIIFNKRRSGIHSVLNQAGFNIRHHDNAPIVTRLSDGVENDPVDEVTVQAILDGYDEIQDYKKEKRAELRVEFLRRVRLIYPDAEDMDDDALDMTVDICNDVFRSIIGPSRSPNDIWQSVIDTRKARRDARQILNSLTTIAEVEVYDVVNTPAWP